MFRGISYLNSLEKWSGRQGEFSLGPIRSVMADLHDPQDKIKTVHVTGTNGKGSCTAAIASILSQNCSSIGAFISPHLHCVNERILIDGMPVSDEVLDRAMLDVERVVEAKGIRISYFEAITAAAFIIFEHARVDWAVIEVGLGGRLDATNVIASSHVAVITSIDFDHTKLLGSTLPQIAAEKAGIMRRNRKVICGRITAEAAQELRAKASEIGAKIELLGADFNNKFNSLTGISTFACDSGDQFDFTSMLDGRHQVDNMSVAIRVGRLCGASVIDCQKGLGAVFWPGRLEQGQLFGRKLIMDAAHNPAGIDSMLRFLEDRGISQATFIFGVLETKEWRLMLSKIVPCAKSVIIMKPDSTMAVSVDLIEEELMRHSLPCHAVSGTEELLEVLSNSEENLPIVACGSIYMLGGLRAALIALPDTDCSIKDRPIWGRMGDRELRKKFL